MDTEDKAKNKWCPQVRYTVTADDNNASNRDGIKVTNNPQYSRCIASACMMWRWNLEYDHIIEEGQGGDLVLRLKRKRGEPIRGHCGLAGKP